MRTSISPVIATQPMLASDAAPVPGQTSQDLPRLPPLGPLPPPPRVLTPQQWRREDALRFLPDALANAEQRISTHYGIQGRGTKLKIELIDDPQAGFVGRVSTTTPNGSPANTGLTLTLNLAYYRGGGRMAAPGHSTNLGHLVAHQLTQAVMRSGLSLKGTETDQQWFSEGAAAFIHGGDESLAIALRQPGGAGSLVSRVRDSNLSGDASYAAVRYLHHKIKEARRAKGLHGGGIQDLMALMKVSGPGKSLDAALKQLATQLGGPIRAFTSNHAFLKAFQREGAKFIVEKLKLRNMDTGAIGNLDADGGAAQSSKMVLSGYGRRPSHDPLRHFDEEMPAAQVPQAGARANPVAAATAAGDRVIRTALR